MVTHRPTTRGLTTGDMSTRRRGRIIDMSTDRPAEGVGSTRLRALRGATIVERNDAAAIVSATEELLTEMLERNEVALDDLVSVLFTATPDLTAEFPRRPPGTWGSPRSR